MTVCLITAYPPARRELGGGGWVDRGVIHALRDAGTEVRLLTVTGPEGAWDDEGYQGESAGRVPLEVRGDRWALARIAAGMLVSPAPYLSRKFTAFPGWSAVVDLVRRRSGDSVITSGWPALLAAEAAGVPVAAHIAHNVESVIAEEHAPRLLRLLGENRRLPPAERLLSRWPERVFALSRADAKRLVEQGVAARELPLPMRRVSERTNARAVGFIGKASWPPNATALRVLLTEVHDRLGERGVDVGFVLAGRGTEEFADHPRVISSGWIADEADFYRRVGLVVVPRFGASTGISVKMLEATEHGVAAVVPAALADAVDPTGPWARADTPAEMAEAISRWCDDPDFADPTAWSRDHHPGHTAAALLSALDATGR